MPRFALLTHDWPFPHRDLLLEWEDTARTWRLPADFPSGELTSGGGQPAVEAGVPAERIADHRLQYLTYEGPVGGDRGTVQQADSGEWTLIDESESELVFGLAGRVLQGRYRLRCSSTQQMWLFEQLPG